MEDIPQSSEIQPKSRDLTTWPLFDALTLSSIQEALSQLWIKKILVADDSPVHLVMATTYLRTLPIKVSYCSSAQEAIDLIHSSYADEKYDLILTDMNMEDADSWTKVSVEWFSHQASSFVVTWRNYDDVSGWHGPSTAILWIWAWPVSVPWKKDDPLVRESILDAVAKHLAWPWLALHQSLQRYYSHIRKPIDGLDTIIGPWL